MNAQETKQKDICDRTFRFAVHIVKLCQFLEETSRVGRTLGGQLLRAGTSIGANVEEAQAGHSRPDFISKMGISLREARESRYWLRLLEPLKAEAEELKKILGAIVTTSRRRNPLFSLFFTFYLLLFNCAAAAPPLVRSVDLDLNEAQEVELADRTRARVKLLSLDETRDELRDAVRQARVKVELNGQSLVLTSATYHLPVTFAGVQIDCPITRGYVTNSSQGNAWGLLKDARLRLWPAGSPWIEPGTFVYPLKQRWFASRTQMANEPTFVDGGELPSAKKIYYHYGLDSGGAEGMVEVGAATAGRVISAGKKILSGYDDSPAKPRYDVVYLLDDRGWYYRYSHLQIIDPAVQPGAPISLGQKIGVLGKEGGSGGWSHLHFDITSRQASGLWGIQEGYAFFWEAYQRQYAPKIIALARPHQLVFTGEKVLLDGSKSWSADRKLAHYDWTFTDGTTASGPTVERTYSKSGAYSEILKVTDSHGAVDYDFAVVLVVEKSAPDRPPPTIHPTFSPTLNIHPGDPLTFKVRSFRTTFGNETWDFGDGSEKVTVKSDGNVIMLAKDGYAVTEHRFAKPGHYLVRVERTNEHGQKAIAHLHVPIE